jgi:CBS domain-containing protein
VKFQLDLNSETVERLDPIAPLCVETDVSAREVFDHLKNLKRSAVMVCRDDLLIGIFTERDALRLMASGADLDVPIESVMARQPVTLTSGDSVATAISRMSEGGYRRLPIVDRRGVPIGVISVRHIVRYLVEHFPSAIYTLPPGPDSTTKDREGA